jgi:hypothetical protein
LKLEAPLRALADRLGLDLARRRPRLLLVAAMLSLALWSAVSWAAWWLVGRLV